MASQTLLPSHGKGQRRWESSAAHFWPWTSLSQTKNGQCSYRTSYTDITHYGVCIHQQGIDQSGVRKVSVSVNKGNKRLFKTVSFTNHDSQAEVGFYVMWRVQ